MCKHPRSEKLSTGAGSLLPTKAAKPVEDVPSSALADPSLRLDRLVQTSRCACLSTNQSAESRAPILGDAWFIVAMTQLSWMKLDVYHNKLARRQSGSPLGFQPFEENCQNGRGQWMDQFVM